MTSIFLIARDKKIKQRQKKQAFRNSIFHFPGGIKGHVEGKCEMQTLVFLHNENVTRPLKV